VKTLVEETLGLFDYRLGHPLIAAADVQDAKASGQIDELITVNVGNGSSVALGHENGSGIEDRAWDCVFSTFEKPSGNGTRNVGHLNPQVECTSKPTLLEVTSVFPISMEVIGPKGNGHLPDWETVPLVSGSTLPFDRGGQCVRVADERADSLEGGAQFLDVIEACAAGGGQQVRGLIKQGFQFHRMFLL
jgi:hypothetical protein